MDLPEFARHNTPITQQRGGVKNMAQRIAVVTGAGSGVGRASALALLNDGYGVALAGRRKEPLEETASMAKSGTPLVVPTDVTDPDSVSALFAALMKKFGRLDVLFNNAGGNVPSTNFGDFTFEMFKRVVDVNLHGMFLCANAAYRIMRDQDPQGGRIINNGSISAHVPRPGSVGYTSTKHAVTGMTKTISLDGRKYNIQCGQIDIGNAETPMTARMANGVPQANGTVMVEPRMDVNSVADSVRLMANLRPDANIQFLLVAANHMPFVGRG